jgi:4-carboxymuconolactone decarboxylase
MTSAKWLSDGLLASVSQLDFKPKQRIPFPLGGEGERGVYGPITNGQRMARHLAPEVLKGVGALSAALLRDGALAADLRELIIVRVGYLAASAYEVVQHRSLAERLGVSPAKLDALTYVAPPGLEANEAAAIAFVDELISRNRTSDAVLNEVRRYFSDGQVLEIIIVTGNWWTLARMLETAGVSLDEGKIGEHGVAKDGPEQPPSSAG